MLKKLLRRTSGAVWRRLPSRVKRFGVQLIEPSFIVSTAAVVTDERGRVLLLKHVFRQGSGWGLPGGFLVKGEHPEEAVRRELCEEIGLRVRALQIVTARTIKPHAHIEIIYLTEAARTRVAPKSIEIKSVEWFERNSLPVGLPRAQRRLIEHALNLNF